MIIRFSVANYRSIKEEQTLDFTASGSGAKSDNLIQHGNLTLLKSLVLYGANASGKTNIIRAFFSFQRFILNSIDLKKGDSIPDFFYDPFLLDKTSRSNPTVFKIEFIGNDNKRYAYEIHFNKERVLHEHLIVYETAQPSNLFLRVNGEEFVTLYDKFIDKKVDTSVLSNNLFLSKVGNSPNEQLGDIYLYFKKIEVWNAANSSRVRDLFNRIQDLFADTDNRVFQSRLAKLIRIADTGIDSVFVEQRPDLDVQLIGGLTEELSPEMINAHIGKRLNNQTFGVHKVFNGNVHVDSANFEFVRRQSTGTLSMFAIGGLIINSLLTKDPSIIFLDEFDNSLHPDFCKFLVEIFNSPLVNKNNSQLIFATHETQLLDRNIFRKDQIWFAEKNSFGSTEFFSVSDFKGDDKLREGAPFDKWYRQGKFGGVPKIRKIEFFAEYE